VHSARQPDVVPPRHFVPFDIADTGQSIPARFDRIARRHGARVAIKHRHESWTYAMLADEAARIAALVVRSLPIEPEPVAVMMGQGPRLIAAILGVLKAGHFYVPLDANHPHESRRAVFDDSRSRLIVTDTPRRAQARALSPSADVIDADWPEPAPRVTVFPDVRPDALACIYYTSGSTGQPKGVTDTHRNILHNVLRYTNGLKIASSDRLSLVQSPVFSGVMSSQFGALLNGASLFPYDIPAHGLENLGRWLLSERITIYHSVPAIFRQALRAVDARQTFPDVRIVRLEGDGATAADLTLFREHFTDRTLLAHGLGATECGLVRRLLVPRGASFPNAGIPVGYAVDDVAVRILADDGHDSADGAIGEIAVESRYLSPGYWRRPELTAAAFSPGRRPGTRVYRTGDLGRLAADGSLEHLGRKDGLAKVRGHRVSVAAAEAAIAASGLVREAVVDVRTPSSGETRLVAYVVPVSKAFRPADLRKRLAATLPAHELPSRFVVLDRLPLTVHHKVDRAALPAPSTRRPVMDVPFVAPRTATERIVAAAWASVLDLDRIGVHDNFFDLGGDSLDAVAVRSRIVEQAGPGDDLNLFRCPTVEGCARAIDERRAPSSFAAAEPSTLVRVQPAGSRSPFFFLHADYGGDGSYCLNVARHLPADQPFLGLSPLGRDGEPVPQTIEALALRYLQIVRREQHTGPYTIGGFCSGAVVAWHIAQQLRAAAEDVALLVLIEPPGIESGVLARTVLGLTELTGRIGVDPSSRASVRRRVMRAARRRDGGVAAAPAAVLSATIPLPDSRDTLNSSSDPAAGRIAAIYRRAVEAYVPSPYDGDVLCLQADEERSPRTLAEWRRLAPKLTVRVVPGNHNSCIVKHAGVLAHVLAAGLARA
jgi:amino acid adenylation domain-containing protein